MIRLTGTVEYNDGRIEAWSAGSAILSRWEMYAKRHGYPYAFEDAPRMLLVQVLAHAALGVPEGLEAWLATVGEVSFDDGDVEAVPPTREEPTRAP